MPIRTLSRPRPGLLFAAACLLSAGCAAWAASAAQAASLAQPAGTARGPGAPAWIPAAATSQDRPAPGRALDPGLVLYEGLAGSLVSTPAARLAEVRAIGAVPVDARPGETLWIYLVSDAASARFMPPARVLLRAGREVLLATDGSVPRLTAESDASLHGLKQPVRLPAEPPVVRAAREAPAPVAARAPATEPDPLVEQMVAALTQADYVATWQALDDFETRYTFAPQNDAATQWILDRFRSFGLRADFHSYPQSGPRRNVVATLPGVVDSTKVVYVCAHLDATSSTPNTCAPGADDNASGTAAVIEAARVLSQYRFHYTVKFAAFNGEEQGLVGSANYVADIAGAGEDVVGVFNLDMIAYAGTDPAPPDLVIYTNSASQALATTLADAAGLYVPGALEPVVRVEALAGSDHYSFWRYGYPAILAIEAEAWSSDFCPWYHTCNDRIEQYPPAYPLHCARASLAAVATTAVPLAPVGPFLAMGPVLVDDDGAGGSSGNGDGAPNPGETVELSITVRNLGPAAATGVSGALRSLGPHATVLDSLSAWSDIPAESLGVNLSAFRVAIAGGLADGQDLPFLLQMTDASGSRPLAFSLRVAAPALAYRSYVIDDLSAGNGNGVPDPGEVLFVRVVLANRGARDAHDVQSVATSGSPHLSVFDTQAGAALIPAGGQAELPPGYRVAISPDAVDGEDLRLTLSLTESQGYAAAAAFGIRVGAFFFDDMEADAGWRVGAPGDEAYGGRWTRADPIGTFQGAQPVQPEDDHTPPPGSFCWITEQGFPGGAAGAADVDGGATTLTSPAFDVTGVVHPRVAYWRWYTNNLGSNPNTDTWVAQVSADGGGSWVDLERTTSSANYWQRMSFLLETHIVPSDRVVFRFVASDLGGGSLVEAALDDFEIEGDITPVGVSDPVASRPASLAPPRPNPARGAAAIAFALPARGHARLRLYSVSGRLVRTLLDGPLAAGSHEVVWDGRSDAGHPVASGIYFCSLEAAGRRIDRRITLLR